MQFLVEEALMERLERHEGRQREEAEKQAAITAAQDAVHKRLAAGRKRA